MALTNSMMQLAMGFSSWLGGVWITANADGSIGRYGEVGFFSAGVCLLALGLSYRLQVQHSAPRPS